MNKDCILVQMRIPMTVNRWGENKRLCSACRKNLRGQWRYVYSIPGALATDKNLACEANVNMRAVKAKL